MLQLLVECVSFVVSVLHDALEFGLSEGEFPLLVLKIVNEVLSVF
jgi:hypothetical protein